MKKTIILVGGGTGGHAAPLLAIYNELANHINPEDIYIVGAGTVSEEALLSKIPNYCKIKAGKANRYLTVKNIVEIIKLGIGYVQALKLLKQIQPKVIFAKGGYVSLPVIMAAKRYKIPYFCHESDIVMGKTNEFLAKDAKKVFVSFDMNNYPKIDKDKLIYSGPVLREGYEKLCKADKKIFGFENDLPTILITGGSQGSLNISEAVLEVAEELLQEYNIIHQGGKHSIDIINEFKKKLSKEISARYYGIEFLKENNGIDMMLAAIDISDLVVTRASSTVLELAVKAKPMILVPWQHSAQNHQLKNAEYFAKHNSAEMIDDENLTGEKLKSLIHDLFNDKARMEEIGKSAQKLVPTKGTEIITGELLKEIE